MAQAAQRYSAKLLGVTICLSLKVMSNNNGPLDWSGPYRILLVPAAGEPVTDTTTVLGRPFAKRLALCYWSVVLSVVVVVVVVFFFQYNQSWTSLPSIVLS